MTCYNANHVGRTGNLCDGVGHGSGSQQRRQVRSLVRLAGVWALVWLTIFSGLAHAQVPYFPQTLPASTVVGRLPASAGPTQAIPFAILSSTMNAALTGGCTATYPLIVGTPGLVPTCTTKLSLTGGGTNASLTASNGGVVYSTASALAILAATATANQVLLSGSSTTPAWSTATYPATTTINRLLYSSAANTVTDLATGNSGTLITSAGGVPSISSILPTAVQGNITSTGTIASGTWQGGVVAGLYGGTGLSTAAIGDIMYASATTPTWSRLAATAAGTILTSGGVNTAPAWTTATYPATTTINRILWSSAANVISDLATGNSGTLITSAGGVPSISSTLPSAVQGNITSTGTIASGTWQGGVVAGLYGGTGLSTAAIGDIIYASATTPTWTRLAAVASGSVLTSAGTSTAPAYSASPTLTTSLTVPLIAGGSASGSSLTLESTSGAGSTDTILFKTASQQTALTVDKKQHFKFASSAAPTITAGCGTSPTVTAGSTNTAGQINTGSSASTTCTITFAQSGYTTAPFCVVSTGASGITATAIIATTTLAFTYTSVTNAFMNWVCFGN